MQPVPTPIIEMNPIRKLKESTNDIEEWCAHYQAEKEALYIYNED